MTPLDYDALANKKAKQGRGWIPKDGTNIVRLLPHTKRYFTEPVRDFAIEYTVHFLRVENKSQVTLCPRDNSGFCPACELFWSHRYDNDQAIVKTVTAIKPTSRHLINILDINNVAAGVQAYESNWTVYNGMLAYVSNREWGDMLDVENGRNFNVILTPAAKSETKRNKYEVMPSPNPSSVVQFLPANWVELLDGLENSKPNALSTEQIAEICTRLGLPEVGIPAGFPMKSTPATLPVEMRTAAPPYQPPVPAAATPAATPAETTKKKKKKAAPAPPPPVEDEEDDEEEEDDDEDGQDEDEEPEVRWPPTLKFLPGATHPVCYGKFDPQVYPCDYPCPVRVNCQLKAVGINRG